MTMLVLLVAIAVIVGATVATITDRYDTEGYRAED